MISEVKDSQLFKTEIENLISSYKFPKPIKSAEKYDNSLPFDLSTTPDRKNTQWLNGIGDILSGGYVGQTRMDSLYNIKTATPKPRASTIKTLSNLIGIKAEAPQETSPGTFEFENEIEASPEIKSTRAATSLSIDGIKVESALKEEEKK